MWESILPKVGIMTKRQFGLSSKPKQKIGMLYRPE